ncbi:MAG TPA: LysM peptidoglycan-binding domain-containing protein [Gammaproteobacteria bacterium]|nr:LysM peptidoglycan-binding domain-containing protein [Gammaproteobacteria bacterium]
MPLRTLLLVLALAPVAAWGLTKDDLREDAPQVYTVKKGDTLWDISAKFLDNPWRWPDLWDSNPYISNPDLIYPGDRLRLYLENGEPRLARQRVERLSPKVKSAEAQRLEAITTIDRSVALPYVDRYGLLPKGISPETVGGHLVAGAKERVMYASGDEVFVRLGDQGDEDHRFWYTFHKPQPVYDPASGDLLGYLLEHTGVLHVAGPAGDEGLFRANVQRTYAPIEQGDRLYPGKAAAAETRYMPKPAPEVAGQVVRHVGGESIVGEGQMVVLNLGARDGLEKGSVLIVRTDKRVVEDPRSGEDTRLPGRRKGVVMIIQTGQRLSFGLIMQNRLPIEAGDRVVNPEG